ncbi:nuclear transport factor 2 family protein [Actinoplanes sp. CA-030573]|uniref:nuclear transport factor 2 family protein n=1 Tax=Actinoplanes sp. CA-030573 TaxID=3239898 RepID=UPI003D924077
MSTSGTDIVRQTYAALERGDVSALLELCSPEITVYQSEIVPWGGHRCGHDGLLTFLQTVMSHLDSKIETGDLYAAGDRIIQVGRTQGTVRATGEPFDAAETHVWQVRDDKIVAFEAYVDTDELSRALIARRPDNDTQNS